MANKEKELWARSIEKILPETGCALFSLLEKENATEEEKGQVMRVAQREIFEILRAKTYVVVEKNYKVSKKISTIQRMAGKRIFTNVFKKSLEKRVAEASIKINKTTDSSLELESLLQQMKNIQDILVDVLFMPGISLL